MINEQQLLRLRYHVLCLSVTTSWAVHGCLVWMDELQIMFFLFLFFITGSHFSESEFNLIRKSASGYDLFSYFDSDSVHFSTNPSIFGEMEFLRPCRSQLHDWCQWDHLTNSPELAGSKFRKSWGDAKDVREKMSQKLWGNKHHVIPKIAEYFGRRLFSISPLAPSFPSAGGPGRCFQCHPYIWKVVLVNVLMSCISTGHKYVQLFTYS